MNNNIPYGIEGEKLACGYLKKKKYKILDRNFSAPCGEIDIVAADGRQIVFVEVKSRSSDAFGLPQEAVTPEKQRKIAMTAAVYLKKHRLINRKIRFDVLAVSDGTVTHIPSAFDSRILM